jgi:hypothetical protein
VIQQASLNPKSQFFDEDCSEIIGRLCFAMPKL